MVFPSGLQLSMAAARAFSMIKRHSLLSGNTSWSREDDGDHLHLKLRADIENEIIIHNAVDTGALLIPGDTRDNYYDKQQEKGLQGLQGWDAMLLKAGLVEI
ncbi:hypothetical protein CEUSTIGMA_g8088.t1 [Chlamydomonas eustigma]|uniref:Uncharacterized protein n=1 Tax=Chlamydomonas eustigma TaxID=1157962 RepID=A0A250XC45_9CHLO|nr:hypothetical protein CEUSTIGMA_g8088.t1 [Chlamydomonas eustigma]|eukprot:GAX80653.1 hypothetical protein CEUSTIGMA_g8088.t1 [Chlamydomonas eustigma]